MSAIFRFLRGDVAFHADFSEPAFAVFRDAAVLHKTMYGHLSARFGLRAADMRTERGDGSLADVHLLCSLPSYSTTIRVRAERVEVLCWDSIRVNQQQFEELARAGLEAVSQCVSIPYKSYAIAANLHGSIDGVTTQEFLSRFTPTPPKPLGPFMGSGAVFYYGPEAERLNSFLTLDLSGYHAGALYIRMNAVWDAGKITLRDLPRSADRYITSMLNAAGLVLPPPPVKPS